MTKQAGTATSRLWLGKELIFPSSSASQSHPLSLSCVCHEFPQALSRQCVVGGLITGVLHESLVHLQCMWLKCFLDGRERRAAPCLLRYGIDGCLALRPGDWHWALCVVD